MFSSGGDGWDRKALARIIEPVSANPELLVDSASPAQAAPQSREASRYLLWNRIAIFLAFAGIFVAGFLSLSSLMNVTIPCGVGHGCDEVARSPYSKWFGLPVAYFGLLAYLALAALSIVRATADVGLRRAAVKAGLLISGIGSLISFYLIYTSLFTINATCTWCISSALIMILTFLTHAVLSQTDDVSAGSVRTERGYIAVFALLALVGLGFRFASLNDVANNALNGGGKIDPTKDIKTIEELVPKDGHWLGKVDAPVTIIEFGDLTCPHCKNSFYELRETMNQSHGNLRVVFRHYPLYKVEGHEMALAAAVVSEIAAEQGQARFWQFVEQMFSVSDATTLKPDDIMTMAKNSGLDPEVIRTRLANPDDPAYARVKRDADLGMAFGLRGTPTFFIGLKGQKPSVETVTSIRKAISNPPYNKYLVLGNAPSG